MRVVSRFASLAFVPFLAVLGATAAPACSSTDGTGLIPGDDASVPAVDGPSSADGGSEAATTADTGSAPEASADGASPPDGAAPDGGGALTSAAFEIQLAKINCHFQAQCGFIAAAEEAACEALVDAQANAPLPYANPVAVADGRLAFDAVAARSCLDLSKTKGCFDQLAPAATCSKVYTGTVANAAVCKANAECANGYCNRGTTLHDGCAGTCTAFTATNAACGTGHAPCAGTDYCDTATSHQCKPRSAASAACDPDNGPFCQTGLFCVGATCQASGGGLGAKCASGLFGSSCGAGFFCDDTGTCAARAATGACASFDACNDGLDCVGLTFDDNTGAVVSNGVCKAYLDVNGACDPSLTESGCPGGTACDATEKTCVKIGIAGADCNTGNLYCREGFYCDGTPGKCQALIPIGGTCQAPAAGSDVNCYPSTQCDTVSKTCALVCK